MKESYLSVNFLESYTTKLSPNLRNQYKIIDNIHLSNLLLSPRAHVRNNSYMSCESCYRHIVYGKSETPPKFGISNGWCIGQLPNNLIDGTISDILASLVSKYRIFANVYTYNAGAHKAIKGHHTFFLHDPEHVGSSFQYLMKSGV